MNLMLITWIGAAALLIALATLAWIDHKSYRLPNKLTFPLIFGGLLYHFILALDFYPYLLGAVLGYAVFWIVETSYRVVRKKDGLGRGDAKLLAAGGAWCGALALPFIILLASSSALCFVMLKPKDERQDLKLAFGPYIAGSIAVLFLFLSVTGKL